MADREPELVARIARAVGDIERSAWDALAGAGDPFVSHAFLTLLETSASVGDAAGWTPLPILAEHSGASIAAAPAYLKAHSQGEYVFDHGWAEAWQRRNIGAPIRRHADHRRRHRGGRMAQPATRRDGRAGPKLT